MTDSDRIAALEADNADLRARVRRMERVAFHIGDVYADAGITPPPGIETPPRPAGVGVTRLARRPNPHNLKAVSGGAR